MFQNEEYEKVWFIRVTINCSKSFFQELNRREFSQIDENILVKEEPEEIMNEFLIHLSADYRMVIHLFYYEDMSTREISEFLSEKESTVRRQLTRARRMLKDNIMERGKG